MPLTRVSLSFLTCIDPSKLPHLLLSIIFLKESLQTVLSVRPPQNLDWPPHLNHIIILLLQAQIYVNTLTLQPKTVVRAQSLQSGPTL